MNIDLIYSLLKLCQISASKSWSRKLVLVPFKYPDDYLIELIVESFIDIHIDELYKIVFESIVRDSSLTETLTKQYDQICDTQDFKLLIDECQHIKKTITSTIADNKLAEYRTNMSLYRVDDQSIAILIE